jgi:hypothetical protein
MGFVSKDEALAKGPVVRALDEMSLGTNSRQLLTQLRDRLVQAIVYPFQESPGVPDRRRPDFPTLNEVIKTYLLSYWSKMRPGGQLDQKALDSMAAYLDENWFGPNPHEYARFATRAIYGMGLIKAIDSSLRGKPNPLPIDSYWYIHADRFELISLESERQITLIIATPTPVGELYSTIDRRAACEAWVTTAIDRPVHLEVFPPLLDPNRPIAPGDPAIVSPRAYRISTYKVEGGP